MAEIFHCNHLPILDENPAVERKSADILGPGTYFQDAVGIDRNQAGNSAVGKDTLGPNLNLKTPFHSGQGTENNTPEEAEAHMTEDFLENRASVHEIGC